MRTQRRHFRSNSFRLWVGMRMKTLCMRYRLSDKHFDSPCPVVPTKAFCQKIRKFRAAVCLDRVLQHSENSFGKCLRVIRTDKHGRLVAENLPQRRKVGGDDRAFGCHIIEHLHGCSKKFGFFIGDNIGQDTDISCREICWDPPSLLESDERDLGKAIFYYYAFKRLDISVCLTPSH